MKTQYIIEEAELRKIPYHPMEFIIDNLIVKGTINIINGARGCGKSWFALALANAAVGRRGVGPWRRCGEVTTMIVDGELPVERILDRVYDLSYCRKGKLKKLWVYSDAYAHRQGAPSINLCDEKQRRFITSQIKDKKVEMVVFDNLSALCPGIDENAKVEFDPINRWLMDLRYEGLTIIEVHHTGKGGDQRGTSAHEDHVDLALTLSRPKRYKMTDGCKFVVKCTKDRNHIWTHETVTLQLDQLGEEEPLELIEVKEDVDTDSVTGWLKKNPKLTWQEAVEKGTSRRTYFRAKARLKGIKE